MCQGKWGSNELKVEHEMKEAGHLTEMKGKNSQSPLHHGEVSYSDSRT